MLANFGAAFVDAISEHIRQSSQLDDLYLYGVEFGGGEEGWKSAVWFAEAVGENDSLTTLYLYHMDVIGMDNLEEWGFALMENKTLTKMVLRNVKDQDEIK